MNLLLPSLVLNMIVAGTFGLTFAASLLLGQKSYTLPLMALRRAARFIWSDTPFVNFFSLIYIATVLGGRTTIRLQDYIIFRSIAVLELVFMKAKLAASDPQKQISMMRRLILSEWLVLDAGEHNKNLSRSLPRILRNDIVAFTTGQRLSVMLFKTTIGYHLGCLRGALGPSSCSVPEIGHSVADALHGWKLCRMSDDIMVLVDCFAESPQRTLWSRLLVHMHGVLLRRLGKIRVVYLVKKEVQDSGSNQSFWHSNINLVTGLPETWLNQEFAPGVSEDTGVVG
ncbi:hypothetical protein MMC22_003738 [Lobaria immixta]|nr:hypothetical protein [Lobaria immixta]